MGNCRSCNTEVKSYNLYCPNCGIKHPLLDKEDLKDFVIFKKRFAHIFPMVSVTVLLLFILFVVKIPVMRPAPFIIQQISPELGSKEKFLGCTEEQFEYKINYVARQVFADVLQIKSNIENLENEQGTFEYTVKIVHKMSLKERQKTSEAILGPYENRTIYTQFEEVSYPDEVEYTFKVEPPWKKICKTEKEDIIIEKEQEITKTRQEKVYKSVFRLILERLETKSKS